ncbi:MAG: DMT family transporter [Anaerolineales bacterium]|nr:DMT family transporter [Anaerolineales bacterium]
MSILFGLLSALSWGAGDFTGGMAARKVGAYRSVFYAELIGVALIVPIALFIREPFPALRSILFCLLSGVFGSMGLLLLYHAMSVGLMSVAAPVSALLAAALPVLVGITSDGFPGVLIFLGFGFALLAVWLISQSGDGMKDVFSHLADLKLPLLAGMGFGLYFVFINIATRDGGTVWPMVLSRASGMTLIAAYLLVTRASWKFNFSALPVIALNGILDLGGNFFFILAGQAGRLDVAAVLSSLFPGATVLLAWIALKERLNRSQWVGVVCALIGIVLITM